MSHRKDVVQLVDKLEAQGWTVTLRKGGHFCAQSPDGKSTVFMPGTPSDGRSLLNTVAQLRRAGADL